MLTPVPADQLSDFVQSLQDALYESAMDYYTTHAKRVRRKRARLPISQIGAAPVTGGRVLGSQGWAVRYEWKAGWFAEIRGDAELAKRYVYASLHNHGEAERSVYSHYEECWTELAKMFSSTQTLPPRTKRWAEAKVLADCVALRVGQKFPLSEFVA